MLGEAAQRLLVAGGLIPLTLFLLVYSPLLFTALGTLLILQALNEYCAMLRHTARWTTLRLPAVALAFSTVFDSASERFSVHSATLTLSILFVLSSHILAISDATPDPRKPFMPLLFDLLALVLLSWPLSFIFLILHMSTQFGAGFVTLLFGTCWVADTGALVVGRLCGTHPLRLAASPHKTWEGVAGALCGGILTATVGPRVLALCGSSLLPLEVSTSTYASFGAIATVAGILGDLSESYIKRVGSVHDSGNLLLAHGGALDRLDSFIFAAPAAYYCVHLLPSHAL
eukprot:gnl/Spiro4/21807_TR10694_c0_g2_i1.p1 gnl/Spiro4/21807_TR10694_c0_g2~~gnl/Spiro4/21807_TR10694_c0_g2_i1.p1  ORF type:complete len:287 (+),score=60.38 gnl/Spiro4/21807_TR10694_c0_g2_i1:96-956(+)